MDTFDQLLIEHHRKSLLQSLTETRRSTFSAPPPPPSQGNPGYVAPPTNPPPVQEIPIQDPEYPRPVDRHPAELTRQHGVGEPPRRPPDIPGYQLVLYEVRNSDGTISYEWRHVQSNDPGILGRILNNIGAIWRWFPAFGWVLFSPFEQEAGSDNGGLYDMNDPYTYPWNFGYWWNHETKKWELTNPGTRPVGGWPDVGDEYTA